MKHFIGLLVILFPVIGIAQTKTSIDSLAKNVFRNLADSWTLGVDSNSEAVDIRVYNKFKSLFDVHATIDDDMNVYYRYIDVKSGRYDKNKQQKPFDEYAHDVALHIKNVIIYNVKTLGVNTTDPKNITFRVVRDIDFQKKRKFVLPVGYADQVVRNRKIDFENKAKTLDLAAVLNTKLNGSQDSVYRFTIANDTLVVKMALERDTVRITGITSHFNDVNCINDYDHDAVLNVEDSFNEFGDFTANGRPDYDLDGIDDRTDKCDRTYGEAVNYGCPLSYFFTKDDFEGFAGLQMNSARIKLPELNQLGYTDQSGADAIDVLLSKKGTLKNPGTAAGIVAGGNFTYYFGQKRKRTGVSVGFMYSAFSAEYQLTDPMVYTFKSSDGTNFYRRQVSVNSLKDNINYTVFNLPLMFSYRLHAGKNSTTSGRKSVINIKAGPSILLINNTSSYDAVIDFGGLYQVDSGNNKIGYFDHFNEASTYNIYFTSSRINARDSAGADRVFAQLGQKYDFAYNKQYTGKGGSVQRMTVAFNFAFDLQHKLSEGLTVKIGSHFVYAPVVKTKGKYKPIDRTTDEFQSIYNSNAKSFYSSLGVNLGIVFNL